MSNPFSALDLSDDENITVVKPAEPKEEKRAHIHPNRDNKRHLKHEQEVQAAAMGGLNKDKNVKKGPAGARGSVPQPDVPHPGEKSKIGLKKEQHKDSRKQPADGERRGRQFDRHSGTGRGREVKKGGAGGGNWGKPGDEAAPLPSTTPEGEAPVAGEKEPEEAAPVVEEDPSMTLEEFERLKASKRVGEAFQEKEARKVVAPIEGTVLKRTDDDNYIKLGNDDADLKRKPGHFKAKQKQVFEIDFKVKDTSAEAPPRRGRPEGGARPGGDRERGDRERGDRGGDRPRPPRGNGAPRGDASRGPSRGAPRSGAPGGPAGRSIDTADQSAFPKLGGSA